MTTGTTTILAAAFIIAAASAAPGVAGGALARSGRGGDGVPNLDVKTSCSDAQKFSTDGGKAAFKGCMQDETNARTELAKRWGTFRPKDRQDCVQQGIAPSPSYVEVLTCLEMNTDAIRNAPRVDGKPVPQIGGPVAPGLGGGSAPKT